MDDNKDVIKKRVRVDLTRENLEWMTSIDESASRIINTLLNGAREAEEYKNDKLRHTKPVEDEALRC